MYMFDLNQRYNRHYNWCYKRPIVAPIYVYIPGYHTNGRSLENMIGVVVNHLVGVGL